MIIDRMKNCLEDLKSTHTKHSLIQMVRQSVYQIAACYEYCHASVINVNYFVSSETILFPFCPPLRIASQCKPKVGG
jgi:hypothetical protein